MIELIWTAIPPTKRFRAVMLHTVLEQIIARCAKAKNRETGGILIGHYSQDGMTVYISEATDKPKDSLFGRVSFQRGSHGLKALLERRWQEGLYYLGEWHFHPGGSPEPSAQDRSSMRGIALDASYACKAPLLLILGGRPPERIALYLGVYPAHEDEVRMAPAQ